MSDKTVESPRFVPPPPRRFPCGAGGARGGRRRATGKGLVLSLFSLLVFFQSVVFGAVLHGRSHSDF
jgi:hypothetical protein